MAKKKLHMVEMSRTVVENVAKIMGPYSACANALADADTHDGPVKFYQTERGTILVEKLPKEGAKQ